MNKADLIAAMANDADISSAQATRALDTLLEAIVAALGDGDKVTLEPFGTFSVAVRAARTGENPRTHEVIEIPEAKVPKFRPGKQMLDAVE